MVLPRKSAGELMLSSLEYMQNALGERLYMFSTLISASFAAERMTEVAPTAYSTCTSPAASACVWSAPEVISAYFTSMPSSAKAFVKIPSSFSTIEGRFRGEVTWVKVSESREDVSSVVPQPVSAVIARTAAIAMPINLFFICNTS